MNDGLCLDNCFGLENMILSETNDPIQRKRWNKSDKENIIPLGIFMDKSYIYS
jgi:hypothetical protein|tara:strand:+ start:57 stop:215 length:159 start_codon:yes stop_codon:yes gene_type:complete